MAEIAGIEPRNLSGKKHLGLGKTNFIK